LGEIVRMDHAVSQPWARIILLYGLGVFGMLVVSIAVPALGGIAAEFHPQSPALIGWVMSSPALAAALASLLIGAAVDRFGDRPIIVAGIVLAMVGDLGVIAAPDLLPLLGWRVVGGVGYVGMVLGAVTMMTRLTTGRQRVVALTLWSTVIPASFILSGVYGSLFAAHSGWRMAFGGHMAGLGVLGLLVPVMLPSSSGSGQTRLAGIGAVLSARGPYLLGACFAAAAFLQTGFVATLPVWLSARLGLGEAVVHAFSLPAMAANVVGATLFGMAYNRGVAPALLGVVAVCLALACGAGLILLPTGMLGALALDCGLMLGLGMLVGMWALLPMVCPTPALMGATSGMITQITLLGVLLGPPLAFASLHGAGLGVFLGAGCVVSLLGWPVWRKGAAAAR